MNEDSIQDLRDQIRSLRRHARIAAGILAFQGITVLLVAAAGQETRDNLTLQGPEGHKIELVAHGATPGIWITRGGKTFPLVAIFNDRNQGAVVGVFGPKD